MSTSWTDERVDAMIGRLLRAGVLAAAAIVLLGAAVYLARHGASRPDYGTFTGEPGDLRTFRGIVHGAANGSGRALIQVGLLVLIGTPIARVALALLAFAAQRDRLYLVVAGCVLAILLGSLIWG